MCQVVNYKRVKSYRKFIIKPSAMKQGSSLKLHLEQVVVYARFQLKGFY